MVNSYHHSGQAGTTTGSGDAPRSGEQSTSGGGSGSDGTKSEPTSKLFPDGRTQAKAELKLILQTYGANDALKSNGQTVKTYLDSKSIPNAWWIVV